MSAEKIEEIAAQAAKHPVGSKLNPVRVFQPSGEQDYLRRLRCKNGHSLTFVRKGSEGGGPYGNMLDNYLVSCPTCKTAPTSVYMDMYHMFHDDLRAAEGFTLAAHGEAP